MKISSTGWTYMNYIVNNFEPFEDYIKFSFAYSQDEQISCHVLVAEVRDSKITGCVVKEIDRAALKNKILLKSFAKQERFLVMYYVSEAKLTNTKTDLLSNYHMKAQPETLITPLIANEYNGYRATFQSTMKLTILIGQFFGLNPVLGVCEPDPSRLRFKIRSWRFVYSLLSIFGQCSLVCFCFLKLFTDSNPNLSANASLVFYTTNCVTSILFLRLALRWPALCQQIAKTESLDPSIDQTLVKKCNVSCVLVLFLALLEHLLSDLSGLAGAIDCQKEKNLFEAFITVSFPWVFHYIGYNHFIGSVLQFINIQFTFNWNFADVFVICVSFYLTSRIDQVNRKIVAVYGKYAPPSFWRSMREDYSRVTYLVRRTDDVIGAIIFISFANNLFFICLQLLHTLADGINATPSCQLDGPDERPLKGYEQTVYFVFSFAFLISRSLAVSLIAARVHAASREPAHALYFVPSTAYCVEVQRLLDQIHGETIALSGLQFFNVKRGLVLTIAGTIVTYELVLMQFTGVAPTPPPPTVIIPVFVNTSRPLK